MKENELCNAVKGIGWAYFWIHIHINLELNLGAWDILPDWAGFYFIFAALPILAKEVPSIKLLRPLTLALLVWSAVSWFFTGRGDPLTEALGYFGPLASTLINVISLYFHFQLLTDMAQLATKYDCPSEKWILHLRTIRTIIGTLISLPILWQNSVRMYWIYLLIAVIQVGASLAICRAMFLLRKELWSRLQG